MSHKDQFLTHDVHNVPEPLLAYNAWTTDPALREAVERVQCLDVLRTLQKEPLVRDALVAELASAGKQHKAFDQHVGWLYQAFEDPSTLELRSRLIVEQMALALQAAVLIKAGNAAVADAFCRSRLDLDRGLTFGTLGVQTPFDELIARATPDLN